MGVLVELLLLLHVEISEAPEVKPAVLPTDKTFPFHNIIQQECQMQQSVKATPHSGNYIY